MRASLVLFCALLSGCASFGWFNRADPADLARRTDYQLCGAYDAATNHEARGRIRAEISRRNLIPEGQWLLVQADKIRVGSSECAMLAAWGWAEANDTVTALGKSTQWVFNSACPSNSYCPPWAYAYTVNGVVTAIQRQ